MQKYLLFLSGLVIGAVGLTQDTITLKNGRIIVANVIEILDYDIRYREFVHQDGPIRNVKTYHVKQIKYSDGKSIFLNVVPPPKPKKIEGPKPYKDLLFSRGFFIEGHFTMIRDDQMVAEYLGFDADPQYDTIRKKIDYGGIGIHFGYRFNFTQRKIWRPGLQIAIFRFGLTLDSNLDLFLGTPSISFQPLNVTYCNIFKLKQNSGVELNLGVWPNFISRPKGTEGGLAIAFQAKYRFKGLSVGVDYQYTDIMFSKVDKLLNSQSYSIVIGRKF